MKKKILIVLAILCIAGITLTGVLYMNKNKKQNINNDDEIKYVDNSFNLNLIKKVNRLIHIHQGTTMTTITTTMIMMMTTIMMITTIK